MTIFCCIQWTDAGGQFKEVARMCVDVAVPVKTKKGGLPYIKKWKYCFHTWESIDTKMEPRGQSPKILLSL